MNKHTRNIVLYAVILALTAVLGWIPFVFLIPMLFVVSNFDFKAALFSGAAFGVISLLFSFMGGSLVSAAFLAAPWIPIVPRIFVAVLAWIIHKGLSKIIGQEKKGGRIATLALTGAAGSLLNTGLVTICLYFFTPYVEFGGVTVMAYIPYILLTGLIELAVNTVLLPPVSMSVAHALKKRGSSLFSNPKTAKKTNPTK